MSENDTKVDISAIPILPPKPKTKRRPPRAGLGRVKGTPNKTTTSVRNALIEAFENLGGVPSLVKWAQGEPTEFYKLWAKILPTQVNTEISSGTKPVTIQFVDAMSSAALDNDDDVGG